MCLQAHGFEHPMGPPPPGMRHGPGGPGLRPPRDPAFATAFKACAAEQGVQLPAPGEKPAASANSAKPPFEALDRDKLDTCMSSKGFKRPGPGRDDRRPVAP
jgi:hypothetical protein